MERKSKLNFWTILIFLIIVRVGFSFVNSFKNTINNWLDKDNNPGYVYDDKIFSLITTPENKVLESIIKDYAKKHDFDINITYADNLEIVDKLNSGEKYDAIWSSNSIWLDMLNGISTSDQKSTSITPMTFGIKNSKAEELGLKNKQVTI